MNTLSPLKPPGSSKQSHVTNPFARALAETEKSLTPGSTGQNDNNSLFSDALSRTGGSFDFDNINPDQQDPAAQAEFQRQQAEEAKKARMKAELHRKVNPVEMTDVYNAREKKVKEEIDKLRHELKGLAQDVAKFQKDVDITLMSEVVSPGQEGKYYLTFFQKLRAFIMLLRQKVKSASTWATQMHAKKGKKKAKKGMNIGGQMYEQTTTIHDMAHHERSSQFSGG